jgi:hypothetical protein
MLVPKPRFHKLAQNAIDQLSKDGITCTPDEILWLQDMAEKTIRSTPCDQIRFFEFPVPCGNIALLPPSAGVKQWLREVAAPWFSHDKKMDLLCCAYALAHGRNPDALFSFADSNQASDVILAWTRKLTCTLEELESAVSRILGISEDYVDLKTPKEKADEKAGIKSETPATDWGEIIALLCHYYPQSREYWLWQTSEENAALALGKISSIMPQDMKIDAGSAKFRALGMFKLAVESIRESRKVNE